MNIDSVRNMHSLALAELVAAERTGDLERIGRAQAAVTRAEKLLVETTLADEGGWKP